MNRIPITFEHQELLSSYLDPLRLNNDLQFAEYSFMNIFLYRREHDYRLIETDPPLVVGEFKPGKPYIIPTVTPDKLRFETLVSNGLEKACLFPIPDNWIELFKNQKPKITTCREDSDYLFKREKLSTLQGRHLSSRRNLLHQLERVHLLRTEELTEKKIPEALAIDEAWQNHSNQSKQKTDFYACSDALKSMNQLKMFGRIGYADDVPFGFTLGYLLSPNTAGLIFFKFLHEYKGGAPYLYQDFAQHLPTGVTWINFMQDLGLPSLRQGKMSYDPELLLTKWRVHLVPSQSIAVQTC